MEVYEIANVTAGDIPLDEQIELGINDWIAEDHKTGQYAFGRTRDEALTNFRNLY